tara:strand:- start:1876 stop:2529 length:654 start_codon:yes stop_codon:yes gene_type:complete
MKITKTFFECEEVLIKCNDHPFSKLFYNKNKDDYYFRMIHKYLFDNDLIENNIIVMEGGLGEKIIPWTLLKKDLKFYSIETIDKNINFINEIAKLNKIKNLKTINTQGNNQIYLNTLFQLKIIEQIGYINFNIDNLNLDILKNSMSIINLFFPIITFKISLEFEDIVNFLKKNNYLVFGINEDIETTKNYICFPKTKDYDLKKIKDELNNPLLFSIL